MHHHGYPVSEILSKKKSGQWWDVDVSTSDYDSLTTLSRVSTHMTCIANQMTNHMTVGSPAPYNDGCW